MERGGSENTYSCSWAGMLLVGLLRRSRLLSGIDALVEAGMETFLFGSLDS
jgi:hypothetical protein